MDPKAIKTLKVLEALEANHAQSQRDLSQSLDISLGLVNSIIKQISQQGYFKTIGTPRSKTKYSLTSEGIAAKEKLSHQYAQFSMRHYMNAKRNFQTLFENLVQRNLKEIVFFGVSGFSEIAYITIKEFNLNLLGIVDESLAGNNFLDMLIQGDAFLQSRSFDIVVITKLGKISTFTEQLVRKGIPKEKIVEATTGRVRVDDSNFSKKYSSTEKRGTKGTNRTMHMTYET
ncbi:MAG: winged helix-turn-helix transcriptional regulator [Desulfatitalea sp.]